MGFPICSRRTTTRGYITIWKLRSTTSILALFKSLNCGIRLFHLPFPSIPVCFLVFWLILIIHKNKERKKEKRRMDRGDEVSVEQLSSNLSTYQEQILQVCNFHAMHEFGCLFHVPSCNCNCNPKGGRCYFLIERIWLFRAFYLWGFFTLQC